MPRLILLNQGVSKRCRLSWLTNSAVLNKPEWGGGEGGIRGLSWIELWIYSAKKLWRSNNYSICWIIWETLSVSRFRRWERRVLTGSAVSTDIRSPGQIYAALTDIRSIKWYPTVASTDTRGLIWYPQPKLTYEASTDTRGLIWYPQPQLTAVASTDTCGLSWYPQPQLTSVASTDTRGLKLFPLSRIASADNRGLYFHHANLGLNENLLGFCPHA
jgi:hypothetical protein